MLGVGLLIYAFLDFGRESSLKREVVGIEVVSQTWLWLVDVSLRPILFPGTEIDS